MNPPLTQGVSSLSAFKRGEDSVDAERLSYPELWDVAQQAESIDAQILRETYAESVADGSIEQEERARAAAIGYFVLTGLQLQYASEKEKPIVSQRMTEAAIELWGKPDTKEARAILNFKLSELRELADSPGVDKDRLSRLIDFYEPHESTELTHAPVEINPQAAEAATWFVNALDEKFRPVLEIFDDVDNDQAITASEAAGYFREGLTRLAEHDDVAWSEWKFDLKDGSAALSADVREKTVSMGKKRAEFVGNDLKAKFCHEVLVHALRSVNGEKIGDEMMQYGLPGFNDGEEGIATFIEFGITGEAPESRSDRYLDYAFALGQFGDRKYTRLELQQVFLDREIVRKQAAGEKIDEEKLRLKSFRQLNRIFRGSIGNDYTVNTKDLAYYNGFKKIAEIITEARVAGKDGNEVLEFIMSGKFDPGNSRHLAYVEQVLQSLNSNES